MLSESPSPTSDVELGSTPLEHIMKRPDGTIYTVNRTFDPFDKTTSRRSPLEASRSTTRKRPSRTPSPAPRQHPWSRARYADGTLTSNTTKSSHRKHSKGTMSPALSNSPPSSRHHTPEPTGTMSSKAPKASSDIDPESEAEILCLPFKALHGSSETTGDLLVRPQRPRSARVDPSTHSSDTDVSSGARGKGIKEGSSKESAKETITPPPRTASTYRRRYRGYGV